MYFVLSKVLISLRQKDDRNFKVNFSMLFAEIKNERFQISDFLN